jgi:hypothetical protein
MKNSEIIAGKPTVVRGKYANLLQQGTNIAVLDPDLVEHFPDSESVNQALRAFLVIGEQVESASIHVARKGPRASGTKRGAFDPRSGMVAGAKTARR